VRRPDGAIDIHLTQGQVAVIDEATLPIAVLFRWTAQKSSGNRRKYYVVANGRDGEGRRVRLHLHRLVADAPQGLDVDHWDGNTLNNRLNNLRVCSESQNLGNSRRSRNNTSGFKGVASCKRGGPWKSYIWRNGRSECLGRFDDAEAAARAYDDAARETFGEFARVNFPVEGEMAA
jgi:hypothetical protein